MKSTTTVAPSMREINGFKVHFRAFTKEVAFDGSLRPWIQILYFSNSLSQNVTTDKISFESWGVIDKSLYVIFRIEQKGPDI